MRFSEAWLREFVDPPVDTSQLVHQLTMAGLEVGSVEPAAGSFSGVVVSEVLSCEPHPQADRLRICRVFAGNGETLQIVCGAPNVRPGLRVPLAKDGAELPGGLNIRTSELRGIASSGMLCSPKELGIDDPQSGLMELPADAPIGTDLRDYLGLEDQILEVDLTPNRADCLSVEGIAREVALLSRTPLAANSPRSIAEQTEAAVRVTVTTPEACPVYLGRSIQGVSPTASTPLWMRERLRRAGIRSLGPIIDVTNYVLLELGQPLHAFDVAKLKGGVRVRYAKAGESLRLLNEQTVSLQDDVLVIADDSRPLALAGIMGGADSAVGDETRDIFLECAFFTPTAIMGRARRFGLATESSQRFERGVDPALQSRAIERASELILSIAGGQAGPIVGARSDVHCPRREWINLRRGRVSQLLGMDIDAVAVADMLGRLGFEVEASDAGWQVKPPSFRFDVSIEADVIEEIGRVFGYDSVPRRHPAVPAVMVSASEARLDLDRVKDQLVDRGYQEAITYSFIEPELQSLIDPDLAPLALKNPISAELAVMRTSLWPGLLDAALKNLNRQQDRVRFFESGLCFRQGVAGIEQNPALAILAMGAVLDEQWAEKSRELDFFDLKGDVESIVALTGRGAGLRFETAQHVALHPGQTARILLDGAELGWMGMLHPGIAKKLDLDLPVFLCHLDLDVLLDRRIPKFKPLSKFPQVRRDIAVIVDEAVSNERLMDCAGQDSVGILRDLRMFDVYRGQGVEPGKKSVALALIFQGEYETLVDAQVDDAVQAVLARLQSELAAKLRD